MGLNDFATRYKQILQLWLLCLRLRRNLLCPTPREHLPPHTPAVVRAVIFESDVVAKITRWVKLGL